MEIRRIVALAAAVGILALPGGSGAELPESKDKLIHELLTISGIEAFAEQMLDQAGYIEIMRIQQEYGPVMELALAEEADLSEEDRERLMARLADFEQFALRFHTLFTERLDFPKIIKSVYHPLYRKYFTADELEKMVAFYRTPVGRKAIEVMPGLMQEAGAGVDEAIRPQAAAVIQEIVAEERAKLKE